ncbi:DUF4044 domain-containing protein [Lacticaseibacillus songhuajiangensis]|jgi:hypothetical protein|nr:DUF4044 domain-containing protein [Lacticaseibacillus songhuajiangensis]
MKKEKSTLAKILQVFVWVMLIVTVLSAVIGILSPMFN